MPAHSLGEIGRETLAILDRGEYLAPGGGIVSLRESLDRARQATIHYTPQGLAELIDRLAGSLRDGPPSKTRFDVVNATTLAVARNLSGMDEGVDVLALNFASAKRPGGGFLGGSRAQEESLARASGLYACLLQAPRMYETNRACASALYTDHMIYSPGVPVFRDDEGNLLPQPYPVSFLTAPAVNVGALKSNELPQIEPTLRGRLEKLLTVALVHGHGILVLGAWGCGAFKNDPQEVARWFHEALVENPVFAGAFQHVIFAIVDWSPNRRFIAPFERQFEPLLD